MNQTELILLVVASVALLAGPFSIFIPRYLTFTSRAFLGMAKYIAHTLGNVLLAIPRLFWEATKDYYAAMTKLVWSKVV